METRYATAVGEPVRGIAEAIVPGGGIEAEETERDFFRALDWSPSRFEDDPPNTPMVIEGMLPQGIVALLYSAGGCGKSSLFLSWLVRVALANVHGGVQVLGHDTAGGAVALVSAEDPDLQLNRRLVGMVKGAADEYGLEYDVVRDAVNRYSYIGSTVGHCVPLFRIDDRKAVLTATDYFEGLVEHLRGIASLRIVGIDTKARFSPGEGGGNNVATQEIAHYERLAMATGATVVLLHHTNKASRNGLVPGSQAFRDASALFDSVRAAFYLRVMTDEERDTQGIDDCADAYLLENAKQNYGPIVPPKALTREGWLYTWEAIKPKQSREERKARKGEENLEKVVRVLQAAEGGPWSQREIVRLCRGQIHKAAALDALRDAADAGFVSTERGSRNAILCELTEEGRAYTCPSVPGF